MPGGSVWQPQGVVFFCALTATLTTILAILLSPLGWPALMLVFF